MSENSGSGQETEEQSAFRAHCRNWLAEHTPPLPNFVPVTSGVEVVTDEQLSYYSRWQKSAYDGGLVGADYPQAYGGGGKTECQVIANQEMLRAKTPILPGTIGLGMAAPTILHHASEDLKQRLLPPLLSGEELWCQGFSEPGAGSDLAGVQTSAVRTDHGTWVINGHKVWTSTAQFASWMILLTRTDKSDRYNGMTYFVVPIKSELGKSVTVRPLIKITGETGFNEVLFDNLEVDDSLRLDAVGKGWQVAMTTLLHERNAGGLVTPMSGGQAVESKADLDSGHQRLLDLASSCQRNGRPAIEDPVLSDKVMQLTTRLEGIKQHRKLRKVSGLANAERMGLQEKLLVTEYRQKAAAVALEIEGLASTLSPLDDAAPDNGHWPLAYLSSFGGTIAAGTSEIQKNILGERVLGLAKSK
ncbi:MAG: acyl-CoA dehydrogenase family protein [Pseudomonadota bacterium]